MGRRRGAGTGRAHGHAGLVWMAALLVTAAVFLIAPSLRGPAPVPAAALEEARAALEARVRTALLRHDLARSDGWMYAIDVAQLMSYAAMRSDEALYRDLHGLAQRLLFVRTIQGGWPHTLVAWRVRATGAPEPEASGTTEALELSRALWLGAARLGHAQDRITALRIIEGYLRHQHQGEGPWIVRNHYVFADDAFADHSYLVDYDPDFVMRMAFETGRADVCTLALKSRALVEEAATPAGLLRSIITPGLLTLMPMALHSPNNVEKLANVASVAERAVGTNPVRARQVLDFAVHRASGLKLYYDADTGEPRGSTHAGLVTRAALVRLAIKLRRPAAKDLFLRHMLATLADEEQDADARTLYELGQVLLAFAFARDEQTGAALPAAFAATTRSCLAD